MAPRALALALLLLSLPAPAARAYEPPPYAIAYATGRLWGFLSPDGPVLVPPRFDGARSFREGLGAVKVGALWGFVDVHGTPKIPPAFDDVGDFSCGVARAKKGQGWGLIDPAGRWTVQPTYEHLQDCRDGVVIAELGCPIRASSWVLISREGKVIIPDVQPPFRQGLTQYDGWIQRTIWDAHRYWDHSDTGIEDLYTPSGTPLFGMPQGWLVSVPSAWRPLPFRQIYFVGGPVMTVNDECRTGLFSLERRTWLIPLAKGRFLGVPRDGLVSFAIRDRPGEAPSFGYLDFEGKVAILPRYEEAFPFNRGLAAVRDAREWLVIDHEDGTLLHCGPRVPSITDALVILGSPGRRPDGDVPCYTRTGRPVSPDCPLDWIERPHEGLHLASRGGRVGFLDAEGTWVVPPAFDEATSFENGRAIARSGATGRLLSRDGTTITTWAMEPGT